MHKYDTKTKKRSPVYNSCASLRMSNDNKLAPIEGDLCACSTASYCQHSLRYTVHFKQQFVFVICSSAAHMKEAIKKKLSIVKSCSILAFVEEVHFWGQEQKPWKIDVASRKIKASPPMFKYMLMIIHDHENLAHDLGCVNENVYFFSD